MFLIGSATAGINTGDIIFQLITFIILLIIPVVLIIFVLKKRKSRLNRIEEKLDKLLNENENQRS